MNNNSIYGGILYPNSSFHIDKIYLNFKAANENAVNDGVLVGRYVLIAYTKRPMAQWERTLAAQFVNEVSSTTNTIVKSLSEDMQQYITNLRQDEGKDYDRILCRKVFSESQLYYEPIANLSTSIDFENGESNAFLQAFESIVHRFELVEGELDINLTADINEALRLESVFGNPETGIIARANRENSNLTQSIENAQQKENSLNEAISTATEIDNTLTEITINAARSINTDTKNTISQANIINSQLKDSIFKAESLDYIINQSWGHF